MNTTPVSVSSVTRRRARAWWIPVCTAAIIAAATVPPVTAHAAEYPSWAEVEAARANESSKQFEIERLTKLLASLKSRATAARQIAAQRATDYETAQARFDQATYRAAILDKRTTLATGKAEVSRNRAGRLAARLAHARSSDTTLALLLNEDQADGLLYRLSTMSRLAERSSVIFEGATKDANLARSLTDQAVSARAARQSLADAAARALDEASTAAQAAEDRLADQEVRRGVLQAQLSVLRQDRAATEAEYRTGEEIRQRQAAAAAARGTDAVANTGRLSGQGWALPVSGWISDHFGARPDKPVSSSGSFHYATDLAAGCGAPIYAATAGTVVYAARLGTYGNWVLIDHGNGIQTGYAHIRPGGILVSVGQQVGAGENIARVGTTGGSSGCHLHFEVRVDGSRIDPEPFMSARGIRLG